jgi:hypothetical protein
MEVRLTYAINRFDYKQKFYSLKLSELKMNWMETERITSNVRRMLTSVVET